MILLATLLFIVCLIVELSPRINTDNAIKKTGIGFVLIGALVEMTGKESPFIEIGLIIYLTANICSAYCTRRKRRLTDNETA